MPALDIKTSSKVTGDAKVCDAVQVYEALVLIAPLMAYHVPSL
jgi:hypothetical protein